MLSAVLALIVPLCTFSQTRSNWQRLLPDTASVYYVIGPESEFYRMAAARKVSDDMRREIGQQFNIQSSILRKTEEREANTQKELDATKKALAEYKVDNTNKTQDLIACGQKVASLKPWATVGKVGVVVVGVSVVGIVTASIIEASKP